MKITIDTEEKTITCEEKGTKKIVDLYSKEAFEIITLQWIKTGWSQKYSYTFTWLGRPLIQLPDDMFRIQEVIYQLKPDVIIETGVAHGGSLIYYASLCKIIGKGKVIGIDIEIKHHNRSAVENHELYDMITLIEGSSTDTNTIERVTGLIPEDAVVLVVLDSCHSREHVRKELELYSPFVTVGSYIVATDGIMKELGDVEGGSSSWREDNPVSAIEDFVCSHKEFIIEQPSWKFNESTLTENVTQWPSAWLKRIY